MKNRFKTAAATVGVAAVSTLLPAGHHGDGARVHDRGRLHRHALRPDGGHR